MRYLDEDNKGTSDETEGIQVDPGIALVEQVLKPVLVDGQMIVRWTATAIREASTKFRRISGHKDLPKLIRALRAQDAVERATEAM